MVRGSIAIYNNNEFTYTRVHVRDSNTWKNVIPYVFTEGHWCFAGWPEFNYGYLIDSNNKFILDSDNKNMVVRV